MCSYVKCHPISNLFSWMGNTSPSLLQSKSHSLQFCNISQAQEGPRQYTFCWLRRSVKWNQPCSTADIKMILPSCPWCLQTVGPEDGNRWEVCFTWTKIVWKRMNPVIQKNSVIPPWKITARLWPVCDKLFIQWIFNCCEMNNFSVNFYCGTFPMRWLFCLLQNRQFLL